MGTGGMPALPPTPTSRTVSVMRRSTGQRGTTSNEQTNVATPTLPLSKRPMQAITDHCSNLWAHGDGHYEVQTRWIVPEARPQQRCPRTATSTTEDATPWRQ